MTRLEWAIVRSFADYIRSGGEGRVFVADGARESADGGFVFPLRAVEERDGARRYAFDGLVRFVAHGGVLNLPIGSVEVHVTGGDGRVEIADPDEPDVRLVFARGAVIRDGQDLELEPRIEEDGSELFFYRYPVGMALDPLRIRDVG